MLLFLDTEFYDYKTLSFISLGLCDERAEKCLYLESDKMDLDGANAFVRSEVLPQLGKSKCGLAQMDNERALGDILRGYLSTHAQNAKITIVADYEGDFTILSRLLGVSTLSEANLSWEYISKVLPLSNNTPEIYATYRMKHLTKPWDQYPSLRAHHALYDARALALSYHETWAEIAH